jgi:hypothetical protein
VLIRPHLAKAHRACDEYGTRWGLLRRGLEFTQPIGQILNAKLRSACDLTPSVT